VDDVGSPRIRYDYPTLKKSRCVSIFNNQFLLCTIK
jgi:hypothetical protein